MEPELDTEYLKALNTLETFRLDLNEEAAAAHNPQFRQKMKRRINAINVAIFALHQTEEKNAQRTE